MEEKSSTSVGCTVLFLRDLQTRLAPYIRVDDKSLVCLDFLGCRATQPKVSVIISKSPLFNPLSPCVPFCPSFQAGPRIAAASLDGPCRGPVVSAPADIATIARPGTTDQGHVHPDLIAARLQYDIEESN